LENDAGIEGLGTRGLHFIVANRGSAGGHEPSAPAVQILYLVSRDLLVRIVVRVGAELDTV
jgi:hypothetical protein